MLECRYEGVVLLAACVVESGNVYSWGRNAYHQLGRCTEQPLSFTPEVIKLPGPPSQLAVGSEHSLALIGKRHG